jgi:hypothetical protein
MFLEKTFLKEKENTQAQKRYKQINVLNKGRIEFFQSTDYSDSGAKHNYYCLAPKLRTMLNATYEH